MNDLPWQACLVLTLGGFLVLGGVIAFIADQVRANKQRKRHLRRFDARVGRDVYRDIKGIHR